MSTTRIAGTKPKRMTAEQRAKIFKALADERRIDIVDSLATHGTQCGTQLADELGISIALLCHHWEVLVDAGVVRKERVGQLRMCTLDAKRLAEATGAWDGMPAVAKSATRPAPKRASKSHSTPSKAKPTKPSAPQVRPSGTKSVAAKRATKKTRAGR